MRAATLTEPERAEERRQALIRARAAVRTDAAELELIRNENRAETLAKRVRQKRINEAVTDPGTAWRKCTRSTVRCPEARIMLLDTPECCKSHVRKIMADVAECMDGAGIRWWIDYGTLLGWLRNGGMIPFDKDGDLGILGEDRQKLLDLQTVWLGMGYHATYAPPKPTQRFRTGDRMKVRLSRRNTTNVDIFIWDEPKPGILDRKNYIGADLYKGREFPKEWALPLGRGLWDGINVSIPAEPERLAEHRYGPDWRVPQRSKHPPEVRK